MNNQKSFEADVEGTLYVVPTPIGNLEDITFRALQTLKSVDIIAAEDTRNTKKLLHYFEIDTPLISYHEHNKMARENQLIARLEQGHSIAIVSDAGMPAISDPGSELVASAIAENYSVVVLPGANAALCALVGSGLPSTEFLFYGFLPRKKKERDNELKRLNNLPATLLFYESPYRIKETLKAMEEQFGKERRIVIARELTKRFEEYARGTIAELLEWSESKELKGEFCIVVDGRSIDEISENTSMEAWWQDLSIVDHVAYYINEQQMKSKEAIKTVALDRDISKRDVYQAYHVD
ncbi:MULTISPECIES: 16S rRNA (cytidine(1402)-2'-O)-methyltransferase [unclassified Virgibacillus]|uniref:16S rRNA (cytidine(1402)-2'-O)-methyltransferase n=1 Tax=unclassified Virgibacillus TaxID=2620237 RepID=UPI0024DE71D1|nr:16S rRNA (cytidine(1402)-2'-O)-methyltransferase [Virgibacillus sp. LDC-1]